MSKKPNSQDPLLTKAEAQLAHAPASDRPPRSADELLHELQVHQIELKMQNEELRLAQVALEESRDRYVDLYELAPVGYLTLSREAQIATINLTGAALLGEDRKKLLSRRFAHFIAPVDIDRWQRYFVHMMQHGDTQTYELVLQRSDSTLFNARLNCLLTVTDAAAPVLRIMLTDITELKQAEAVKSELDQRLRDQQFYTRSLIESNTDAIITTDPSGIISDANKQMEALTGCTRDELIGAPFSKHFTDPKRAESAIQLALNEKKVVDYELTARAIDGKETVVSYNAASFYDRNGKLQGVFAAARDITQHNRLLQMLQEKNAELEYAKLMAEKANRAKSVFLSNMSHELRTPLNSILGFAQLMERSSSPPQTEAQMARLHKITDAGWYLLRLINEILDLATIESGQLSLVREPVSLGNIMRECQAMIEPQAQQHDIRVSFLPFDNSLVANADQTRTKQVLINLLSNAIKYNIKQGTVEVKCTSTAERIRISVKDSGVGLPAEKLAQLFQPFNRLGQEAGNEEGTGIGLVLSKRLVELMEGTIGVESTVGAGSEFWIELIRDVAPQPAVNNAIPAKLAPQNPENSAQRTLLYVENDPASLMLVEQIIKELPQLRMLDADTGNTGIALARTHLPDAILMDIDLPDISGIEALKILRQDPATAHIPVIAITANIISSDIATGLGVGFFEYLSKPIKINEFTETLGDALILSEMRLARENGTGE